MGKVKDQRKKIVKAMIQLKKIDTDFIKRKIAFEKDLEVALAIKNKKEKIFALSRLNDELNGYFIRIYHNLVKAQGINSDYTKIKDLKKLGKLFNEHDKVVHLEELLVKIKESRHKSAHPDAYYVNVMLHNCDEEIHEAIKTYGNKLDSLNIVDVFSLNREEREQDDFLVQKFSQIKQRQDKYKKIKEIN